MPLSREMLEELALDNFASDLLKDEELDFADALQQAQSELRRNRATSHPVFWGPFVLIGDASATM